MITTSAGTRRFRSPIWVGPALVGVLLVGLLLTLALIQRSSAHTYAWTSLPDPGTTGQTLGTGGGSGDGTVALQGTATQQVHLRFGCRGNGTVRISLGNGDISASGQCFSQPVTYDVTSKSTSTGTLLTVHAPAGTIWRITVSS
jgi:hypothetical protein